jgi:hypothetical protein
MAETIHAPTPKTAPQKEYVCPYCGKKEHIPNAVTIAAMEEGMAMMRGEIPHKHYESFEEVIDDLHTFIDA